MKFLLAWTLAVGLLICAFLTDFLSHPVIDLYVIYFISPLLAAWFIGPKTGWLFLIAGVLGWTYVDLIRRPEIPVWSMVANSAIRAGIFAAILLSINRIRVLNEQLSRLSLRDDLTGLPNRRALLTQGELEMQRMGRGKTPLSVVFVDIDNFKQVNDTQGHDAGDALLEDLAGVLSHCIRETDFAARLGGDEFVLLFPETNGATAMRLSNKIKIMADITLKKTKVAVSLSIGVATFNEKQDSFETALGVADELMYEVKASGKNAILQKDIAS